MLNPEVLSVIKTSSHWSTTRQHGKTIYNKFFIYENINIFGYLGARGGPILVHIYPLIYIKFTCQIWKQSYKNLLSLKYKDLFLVCPIYIYIYLIIYV